MIRWPLRIIAAAVLVSCSADPGDERDLAERVTRAIVATDLRPVAAEFEPAAQPMLADRSRLIRLAHELAPLGSLTRVKEIARGGPEHRTHTFIAQFTNGSRIEDMTLGAGRKIAAFHIRPAPGLP